MTNLNKTKNQDNKSAKLFISSSINLIIISLINLLIISSAFAQSPQAMTYQAVIRDNSGALVTNSNVGMRISIRKGSANGVAVYRETYSRKTDANGLISLRIGNGTVVSGDFSTIEWANGSYYIQAETDPKGGTTYTISVASQLTSVPYVYYAKTGGAPGPEGEKGEDRYAPDGTTPGEMLYWNGATWEILAPGNEGDALKFKGGKPVWARIPIMFIGLEYDIVTNPVTGKKWLDRNLGATQVATSVTDTASYGDLYQWGRGTDGHEKRISNTTTISSTTNSPGHGNFITTSVPSSDWRSPKNDNLWQGISGINNPCPTGFRLPTEVELNAERQSWPSNNAVGAFSSPLKLPMAGYRDANSGLLTHVSSSGNYWSSTAIGIYAYFLRFNSNNTGVNNDDRPYGLSVRCIKD